MFWKSLQKAIYAASALFLAFIAGAAAVHFKGMPYKVAEPFVQALESPVSPPPAAQENIADTPSVPDFRWQGDQLTGDEGVFIVTSATQRPVPERIKGVQSYLQDFSANGYTLTTTTHDTNVYLLDMEGNRVHAWSLPFHELFKNTGHLAAKTKTPDEKFYIRSAVLFPDGSLVAVICVSGQTPWGAGIVKVNKDSRPIWVNEKNYFSDVSIGSGGKILTAYHQIRRKRVDEFPSLHAPLLNDTIAILSPAGKTMRTIPLLEAIGESPYRDLFSTLRHDPAGDYLHVNSIEEISHDVRGIEWMKKGNILVSLRNPGAVVVIDPDTKKTVHAAFFPFRFQHDVSMTGRNTLMAFDNMGLIGPRSPSRVVELDPVYLGILWSYGEQDNERLNSPLWGGQQELPNGNILITESQRGRVFEITRAGNVVWDYYLPERKDGKIPAITSAARYSAADLPFLVTQP